MTRGERPPLGELLTPFAREVLREVAHMLRSPLGSIVILADALRERGARLPPERLAKQLSVIHRAAVGLAGLSGDLLTLVDGAPDVGAPTLFSAVETLELVADVVRPVAELRRSELTVHVEADPEVMGPAHAVTRAVFGLALRAAVRTRDGTVQLSAVPDGPGLLRFCVDARGREVTTEAGSDHLLEVFRRDPDGDGFTLSDEGLGLAAAERLIEAMGSELTIDSRAEGELTFAFTLAAPTP